MAIAIAPASVRSADPRPPEISVPADEHRGDHVEGQRAFQLRRGAPVERAEEGPAEREGGAGDREGRPR